MTLPEIGVEVLVKFPWGVEVVTLDSDKKPYWSDAEMVPHETEETSWQPLPADGWIECGE